MLYEMLTGTIPFPGSNPFVIMRSRLMNHPVPPREINPSITLELQEIIYRALERDPKNRYANANEFANDLLHQDRVGVADRLELLQLAAATHAVDENSAGLRNDGDDSPRYFWAPALRRTPRIEHSYFGSMDHLTTFGLFAVTAMLVFYALEQRSHWFILAFAGSCVLAGLPVFMTFS